MKKLQGNAKKYVMNGFMECYYGYDIKDEIGGTYSKNGVVEKYVGM
jgi:hypothetical protein